MSSKQATPAAEYRAIINMTLPLSVIRRLEPYKAKRRRGAFIEAAVVAALDKADQDRERAAV